MGLSKSNKIMVFVVVFLFTMGASAQSYNSQIEAKLLVKKENGLISITGTALNKTKITQELSYKLSVFKTGPNKNQSKNQQSGKFNINSNQEKNLSTTSVNFDEKTKIIILLLIYDSSSNLIGKDRVVFNDDEGSNLNVKNNIANKIKDTATKLTPELINSDVEAKIHVDQQNEVVTISSTAFNKNEITKSLTYSFKLYNSNENEKNVEEEQGNRFVLSANNKVNLSSMTFKLNDTEKKTGVLLIYDLDNNVVAQDTMVFNDDSNNVLEKQKRLLENLKEQQRNSQDVNVEVKDGIELKGIIVEDTKTKPGRDFYRLFYSLYTKNNINGNKVVKIKEVLALGRNTKIEIIVGDDNVFSFFVRPSLDYLTKMNDYAIVRVYRHFKNLEKESKIIKRY